MKVLGISDNHNAGAAVVIDGRLVAAVNEERLCREKNRLGFPALAIAEVLRLSGLRPDEVDHIVVAGDITPCFFLRLIPHWHRGAKNHSGQFGVLFDLYTYYQVAARYFALPYQLDRRLSRALLVRRLAPLGLRAPLGFWEHHQAHAAAAFLCGPFSRALVITADAMGDGLTATVGIGHPDGRVERVFEQSGMAALNPYYSRVTEMLGFVPNRHEGKVTGLAAYGDGERLAPLFRRSLRFSRGSFSRLGNPIGHSLGFGWYRHLVGEPREDVAAACQLVLEEAVTAFVAHWARRLDLADVVLAGGIFENVKLNQRLRELPEIREVSIFPNMSDGGLAAGAALGVDAAKPAPLADAYLGTEYREDEIRRELDRWGLDYTRPARLAEEVAARLARGEVVARFHGRMEYGPRALGHRTIYCRPDDPAVNDWLNRRLGRSEFMPFAPMVLAAAADRCFVGMSGGRYTARFMNMCFDCTAYMKKVAAGCVHVDGTARPQIVDREHNPDAFAILAAYERLTGTPVLINTSFNMHEEPIVMSPADAVRSFRQGRLDWLAIGPYLVRARP